MGITGKIVTLIAGKLKLLSQTVILMIFTRPTYQRDCPEY